MDVHTGELRWEFTYPSPTFGGVMTTAAGLVFAGDHEGNFMAFDAESGENLWHYQTGSRIWGAAATTYLLDGKTIRFNTLRNNFDSVSRCQTKPAQLMSVKIELRLCLVLWMRAELLRIKIVRLSNIRGLFAYKNSYS